MAWARLFQAPLVAAGVLAGAGALVWGCTDSSSGQNAPDASGGAAASDAASDHHQAFDAPADGSADAPEVGPDGGTWLTDDSIWTDVPGSGFLGPYCVTRYASGDELDWLPPVTWEACGTGCETSPVPGELVEAASLPAMSTHPGNRAVLVSGAPIEIQEGQFLVRLITDLTRNTHVGALVQVKNAGNPVSCILGNGRETALSHLIQGKNADDASEAMTASLDLNSKSWKFSQPARPISELPSGRVEFDIDEGQRVFDTGFGIVALLDDVEQNTWTTLEKPSNAGTGVGSGNLAVWLDSVGTAQASVKGWATDSLGIRSVVSSPPDGTCELALSPTTLVGATSPNADCGNTNSLPVHSSLRLWRKARSATDDTVAPVLSDVLVDRPIQLISSFGLKTWGDYAALTIWLLSDQGGREGDPLLLVVRLSTWERWFVRATDTKAISTSAWTLTDTHLLVGQNNGAGASEATKLRQIVRYDLAALDQVGEKL